MVDVRPGGYVKEGHPVKYHSEQYSLCVCAFKQIRCLTLCNMSFYIALSFACSRSKRRGFFSYFLFRELCALSCRFQCTVMVLLWVCFSLQ